MSKTQVAASGSVSDLQPDAFGPPRGIGGSLRAFFSRIRSGDLGSLPVIIGLVIIWTVFQVLSPNFLSANNLVNLALQCAAGGIIAIGVVLVLLLGQIDLSVGSISGLSAAILAIGLTKLGWSLPVAILIALAAGAVVGLFYAFLFVRFGIPSFIITLAGLLGFLGLQLAVLGPTGSVNIPPDSPIIAFTQLWFLPPVTSYVLAALVVAAYLFVHLRAARRRALAGLSSASLGESVLRAAALLVLLVAVVYALNNDRGVPASFLLFIALVVVMNYALTRTKWGRSVFAVGGSVDAARRSGIRVTRVYVTVFVLCSLFAALGGLLAAGRVTTASTSTGAGDVPLNAIAAAVIGGTSLFGGRGSAYSALLGIVVLQSISSGLTLLSLDSPVRYMITGAVLLLAVIIDSLSRRSRASHGRA